MSTTDTLSQPLEATPPVDQELALRLERLAARRAERSPSGPSTPTGPRKRRHPARKSRIAALTLSLITTGGLTAGYSAIDGPTSSVVTEAGGLSDVGETATTVVNGEVHMNKWGPVQVQATFAPDGSLIAVDAVQTPFGDRKSVQINDRAVPRLNSEALTAQNANVDSVSGATYTSTDYELSLQSAIDVARSAGLTQIV